jgi:hypothetical protein
MAVALIYSDGERRDRAFGLLAECQHFSGPPPTNGPELGGMIEIGHAIATAVPLGMTQRVAMVPGWLGAINIRDPEVLGGYTCWSTRIGLPSGSITMKLAGPLGDSSAAITGSMQHSFSSRCSSRTSVKLCECIARAVPPG